MNLKDVNLKEILERVITKHDKETNIVDLFANNGFFNEMQKEIVQACLIGEINSHLGYKKHESAIDDNYRNGYSSKTLQTKNGEFKVNIPRDRKATFDPIIVEKYQRKSMRIDQAIIHLYSQGTSLSDIKRTIKEFYDFDISEGSISSITDEVIETLSVWKNRPLNNTYPIIYMDGIYIDVNNGKSIEKHVVYILMGVNLEGKKEILSLWISSGGESSKFWLNVLTDIKNRGVKNICIACVDGLKGFPEAIASIYPNCMVQQCIVHAIRRSLSYLSYKDRKEFAKDLKAIYSANNEELALIALKKLEEKWSKKYPAAVKLWNERWEYLSPFFEFTDEIRRAIYTTNPLESINNSIRRVIKNKRSFPNEDAAMKIIFLALNNCEKRWTMPIKDWPNALNQLIIKFSLDV